MAITVSPQLKQYQSDYASFLANNQNQQKTATGNASDFLNYGKTALNTYGDKLNTLDPTSNGAAQGGAKAINDYSSMVSGLYSNPGYSDAEKTGMKIGTTAPIAGAYRTAGAEGNRMAAASGNAGAGMANAAEMARSKSRDMSAALGGLQGKFADAVTSGQQFAVNAQGQIPGMQSQQYKDQQTTAGMYQNPAAMALDQSNVQSGQALTASGQASNVMGQQSTLAGQAQQLNNQPGFLKQLALGGLSAAGKAAGTVLGGKV